MEKVVTRASMGATLDGRALHGAPIGDESATPTATTSRAAQSRRRSARVVTDCVPRATHRYLACRPCHDAHRGRRHGRSPQIASARLGERLAAAHLRAPAASRSSRATTARASASSTSSCFDGRTLVFAEVKTRRARLGPAARSDALAPAKRTQVRRMARGVARRRRRPAARGGAALRRDRGDRRRAGAACAPRSPRGRVLMRSGVDERQLLVRRRLERQAVQRRDADAAGSPRGARAWSSRRAPRTPSRDGARRRGA